MDCHMEQSLPFVAGVAGMGIHTFPCPACNHPIATDSKICPKCEHRIGFVEGMQAWARGNRKGSQKSPDNPTPQESD